MEPYLNKQYRLKTLKNYDEYLKFLGINYLTRKIISSVSPVASLTKDDSDSYTLAFNTAVRNMVISFNPGEEFEESRPDGSKLKSRVVFDENKLIHTQNDPTGKKMKHEMEFTDDKLTIITTAEGWDEKCERIYERLH